VITPVTNDKTQKKSDNISFVYRKLDAKTDRTNKTPNKTKFFNTILLLFIETFFLDLLDFFRELLEVPLTRETFVVFFLRDLFFAILI